MDQTLQTALHQQLNTMQEIVKRMAENSRNVKTWCVTLVSALIAFSFNSKVLPWYGIVLPVLPLMYLDMYYLALETHFRQQYNQLIEKHKEGKLELQNVYDIASPQGNLAIFYQFRSKSIWPFYGLLFLVAAYIGYFRASTLA